MDPDSPFENPAGMKLLSKTEVTVAVLAGAILALSILAASYFAFDLYYLGQHPVAVSR